MPSARNPEDCDLPSPSCERFALDQQGVASLQSLDAVFLKQQSHLAQGCKL